MIPKSGNRLPACAKPWHAPAASKNASAGEGRSDKIMLHEGATYFTAVGPALTFAVVAGSCVPSSSSAASSFAMQP